MKPQNYESESFNLNVENDEKGKESTHPVLAKENPQSGKIRQIKHIK